MTDFETFSENFDKIEKQHRKAGKAMVKGGKGGGRRKKGGGDDSDEIDSGNFLTLILNLLNLIIWKKEHRLIFKMLFCRRWVHQIQ